MRKRNICVIICISFILSCAQIAFAEEAVGSSRKETVNGVEYTFLSGVTEPTPTAIAARTKVDASKKVGVGYIGIFAKLFNTSGRMVAGSSWNYNTSSTSSFGISTVNYKTSGIYYSAGDVQFYTGSTYQQFYSNPSPNYQFNVSRVALLSLSSSELSYNYGVNPRGQTYGSLLGELIMGREPDLIEAIGINGCEGYVKAADLNQYKASSPSEALIFAFSTVTDRTIPVYSNDGCTIIDTFILSGSICD